MYIRDFENCCAASIICGFFIDDKDDPEYGPKKFTRYGSDKEVFLRSMESMVEAEYGQSVEFSPTDPTMLAVLLYTAASAVDTDMLLITLNKEQKSFRKKLTRLGFSLKNTAKSNHDGNVYLYVSNRDRVMDKCKGYLEDNRKRSYKYLDQQIERILNGYGGAFL